MFRGNSGAIGAIGSQLRSAITGFALEAVDSIFYNNSAHCPTCSGGAISLERHQITLTRCTFAENRAGSLGGALSVGFGTVTRIQDCVFAANAAPLDSEIHSGAERDSMNISATVFRLAPDSSVTYAGNLAPNTHFTNRTTILCEPGYVAYRGPRFFGCQFCGTVRRWRLHCSDMFTSLSVLQDKARINWTAECGLMTAKQLRLVFRVRLAACALEASRCWPPLAIGRLPPPPCLLCPHQQLPRSPACRSRPLHSSAN